MVVGRVRGVWHLLPVALPAAAFVAMLAFSLVALVRHATRLEAFREAARRQTAAAPAGPAKAAATEDFWSRARDHAAGPDGEPLRAYRVDRPVTDFIGADATTPEAAYGERARVACQANPANADAWPPQVGEVWLFHHHYAAVIATAAPAMGGSTAALHLLESVRGRWQEVGGTRHPSVASARLLAANKFLALRGEAGPQYLQPRTGEMRSVYAVDDLGGFTAQARRLLREVRAVDYQAPPGRAEADLRRRLREACDIADLAVMTKVICGALRNNPVVRTELGLPSLSMRSRTQRVSDSEMLTPIVPYRLTFRDGAVRSGRLVFRPRFGSPHGPRWCVVAGLDWRPPRG